MQSPVIRVVGVGGGGVNAVTQISQRGVAGVELYAIDTDVRKLNHCAVDNKLVIGHNITNGLGAGGEADTGFKCAEASARELEELLSGAHMVFVTAAMGGGTGTGAAPVVCRLAKDLGALTVAVATKPFRFERQQRMNVALGGIEHLREAVDALIVIDNQKLFDQCDKQTSLIDAFAMVDDVLRQAVQGVSDLITVPGTINVDFADVSAILRDAGPVVMGMGEAPADSASADVVAKTVASPLLEHSIVGATNLLLNVTIGHDTSLWQVHDIADAVAAATRTEMPNCIFGTVIDDQLRGRVKLTVLAANFDDGVARQPAGEWRQPVAATSTPASPPSQPVNRGTTGGAGQDYGLPRVPPVGGAQDDIDVPTFVRRQQQRGDQGRR